MQRITAHASPLIYSYDKHFIFLCQGEGKRGFAKREFRKCVKSQNKRKEMQPDGRGPGNDIGVQSMCAAAAKWYGFF